MTTAGPARLRCGSIGRRPSEAALNSRTSYGSHSFKKPTPQARTSSGMETGWPGRAGGRQAHLGGGLVPGHGGGGVVQDDQDDPGPMKDRIDQGRDPGVEEGGVADGGHDGGDLVRRQAAKAW